MESRSENRLRGNDVERLEARDPREQIEIGDVESLGVRDPIRDRDDDALNRIGGGLGDQSIAEEVLVARAGLANALLVLAKGAGEKPRLLSQPLGAAIEVAVAAERVGDELLEPLHVL